MTILVTGGLGFIGSHTCVELLSKGYDVVIIDNLCNSQIDVLDKITYLAKRKPKFYQGDLLNRIQIENIFRDNKINAVIHFAGLKAVGESVNKPLEYYYNNLTGTLNLCDIMKKYNCLNMVFSSSATVYGMNNEVPFREDMERSFTNPYGATKVMIEDILNDLVKANSEWHIVLLRYFNPIGAHESGLLGEKPVGVPNNLLPYIMQVGAGKLECLNIYGNDYDTPDGTGVRDYIHVVDLAEGHVNAINYMMQQSGIEAINLGTGKGYSVLEIVHTFEEVNNIKIKYQIAPRRLGDIANCYADVTKAKMLLRWEARRDLKVMCKDSWNFAKKEYFG